MQINARIPREVMDVLEKLHTAGFLAYIVGGCVRDLLMDREPKDWDITTNARPEQIQKVFPDSVYENNFGTVGVKTDSEDETLKIIEVTTFRTEGGYEDSRRPSSVEFVEKIEDDLARRDFTINAIALNVGERRKEKGESFEIVDPYDGQKDLEKRIIRAVGAAYDRFSEDALRMLRAIRFACQLGKQTERDPKPRIHPNNTNIKGNEWVIETETQEAIQKHAPSLANISQERIRDELTKIIMTPHGAWGIELLRRYGLLEFITPELLEGVDVGQNKHHIYTVWEHNLRALDYTIGKNYPLEIRLGALLHDVGKPRTKAGDGPNSTFYQHEYVGARMTRDLLTRLRFSKHIVSHVTHLVRNHLFYYNVGEVSEAGVRRFISRVGMDMVEDILKIREADRIGSGVPKAFPYKLRHLLFMIDKVRRDPVSPKMLKLDGGKLMAELGIKPSPRVGWILSILLEEVLDDPTKNIQEILLDRAHALHEKTDEELRTLCEKSKERAQEFESGVEEEMKKRHRV